MTEPVIVTKLPALATKLCSKCGTPQKYAMPTYRNHGAEPLNDSHGTFHTSVQHVDWKCRCGNTWLTYIPK